MARRVLSVIMACILFPLFPAHADTLTLRNNAELNGQVQYESDSFTISARFHTGTRTFTFNRKEVRSLEVNSRDYNPGAPPAQFTNLDAQATGTRDAMSSSKLGDEGNSIQNNSKNKKRGTTTLKSPLSTDEFNSAAEDTVCLRDQTKLVGRVTRIRNGFLAIQIGNKVKRIDVLQVTTVLIAPN